MFSRDLRWLLPLLFFLALPPIRAQSPGTPEEAAPVSLVGISLDELVRRYGAPRSVYPARGLEEWQDDVVFVYPHGDFYVYKDRVWQVGLKEVMGIKAGYTRGAVLMALGAKAESLGASVFYPLDGGSWPVTLRFDFNTEGKTVKIFIYRTDF